MCERESTRPLASGQTSCGRWAAAARAGRRRRRPPACLAGRGAWPDLSVGGDGGVLRFGAVECDGLSRGSALCMNVADLFTATGLRLDRIRLYTGHILLVCIWLLCCHLTCACWRWPLTVSLCDVASHR